MVSSSRQDVALAKIHIRTLSPRQRDERRFISKLGGYGLGVKGLPQAHGFKNLSPSGVLCGEHGKP